MDWNAVIEGLFVLLGGAMSIGMFNMKSKQVALEEEIKNIRNEILEFKRVFEKQTGNNYEEHKDLIKQLDVLNEIVVRYDKMLAIHEMKFEQDNARIEKLENKNE